MTRDDVMRLLARLEAAFEHELPDTTMSVYVDALDDLDLEATRLGVESLIRSGGRFFPRVSEIRRAALESGAAFPSFGSAWAEMSSKASTGHGLIPPTFSHVAIDELARQIGWENFRLSDPLDTYFEHAAEERYEAICEREMRALLTGAPALVARRSEALPSGFEALTDGIGKDPTE